MGCSFSSDEVWLGIMRVVWYSQCTLSLKERGRRHEAGRTLEMTDTRSCRYYESEKKWTP